jgi:KaiC/GvpD/RAD55 family RecA-like ATPase
MNYADQIKNFYLEHLPGAQIDEGLLKAPCPFCLSHERKTQSTAVVYLSPDSYFLGYFRCLSRCVPGGFPIHFGRMMGVDLLTAPGYDPDRDPYVRDVAYPIGNLNLEINQFMTLVDEDKYGYFQEFGVSRAVLEEMKIGYNGRYLVYPYFLEDGNCYAARCVLPEKESDSFWHGNEAFSKKDFRIFNVGDIERCEEGALFVTEGENNLLALKELGFPGIAVPSAADLDVLAHERLAFLRHVFLVVNNTPEALLSARSLATRIGFKARILRWGPNLKRGYGLCDLARKEGKDFRAAVSSIIKASKSFSPFSSPEKEHRGFLQLMERERGKSLLGIPSGFRKMDRALSGIRGISIMGGPPKAGKSCFFMQLSTEAARRKTPVIYYDFENGRQTIYTRTLSRLAGLSEEEIRLKDPAQDSSGSLTRAQEDLREMLHYFRVVTDRKVTPDVMRRQIDFLKHETRRDYALVVIDSLHKLPFKDLTERRTGIDAWLRQMEAIRDEQKVSFLVVSELSRGQEGSYSGKPDLASFKESGDIEYSADNAMILMPDWDPLDSISTAERKTTLWMVASRENSPGMIAEYSLEFPFWRFREI